MEKTVCELFAGVGGFRCGLNHLHDINDIEHDWNTVWFNQWEPAEKKTQYAHDCYIYRFGTCLDKNGNDTTNINIEEVDKAAIPDFNLLVGGFPCQDYSVASTLVNSKGIEGKKGVLWWSLRDVIEEKEPRFILLENVDRLLKSPSKQKGRDFGIIISCLRDLDYVVEWRVINAADYGYQQKRKRVFIFASKTNTKYARELTAKDIGKITYEDSMFAKMFPVKQNRGEILEGYVPYNIGEIMSDFTFDFKNAGVIIGFNVFSTKVTPEYNGDCLTIEDIIKKEEVDERFFVPEEKMYYTFPDVTHSDERESKLPLESRRTWQYIKGAKKIARTSSNGHEYIFSEGAVPLIDEYDKPARTILTSEGNFNRSTHLVSDFITGKPRILTPEETERIQGFPTGHTRFYIRDNEVKEIPDNKRRFLMGNALVVNLIEDMEKELSVIFEKEN